MTSTARADALLTSVVAFGVTAMVFVLELSWRWSALQFALLSSRRLHHMTWLPQPVHEALADPLCVDRAALGVNKCSAEHQKRLLWW